MIDIKKYKIRDMTADLYQKSTMRSFYNDVQLSKRSCTKSIEDLLKYFKVLENRIQISHMWNIIEISAEKKRQNIQ